LVFLLPGACQGGPDSSVAPKCQDIACDLIRDRGELVAKLDGRSDVIASYLRAKVGDDGAIVGDYRDIAAGVDGDCDTQTSFMVLSNQELRPKAVVTRCADKPDVASQFFLALPNLDAAGNDFEPRLLHMAAWDEEAKRYQHYAAHPNEADGMFFSVEPRFCLRCHGGPQKLTTWQPLMNEMESPWSQWIAAPGFVSQLFDEYVDPRLSSAPHYVELTGTGFLASASRLQPLIEAGIDRFIGARFESRTGPVALETALALLQPVFCDESVNYASEVHRSGQLSSAALFDRGDQFLLRALVPGWQPQLLTTQLSPPVAGEEPVTLIPVRGRSTTEGVIGLATRRILDVQELLRARAIDWSHPVGSGFRCDLFERGRENLTDIDVTAFADNRALVRALFERFMASYPAPGVDQVMALEHPGATPMAMTFAEFGSMLAKNADALRNRDHLRSVRAERFCDFARALPSAPQVLDLSCP
jgi:hypothetical protein